MINPIGKFFVGFCPFPEPTFLMMFSTVWVYRGVFEKNGLVGAFGVKH